MSLEMGLHRESVYRPQAGTDLGPDRRFFERQELRRRCFWCVFALDRYVRLFFLPMYLAKTCQNCLHHPGKASGYLFR